MGHLSHLKIKNLRAGMHGDGNGLWLRRDDGRTDAWFLRYVSPRTQKRAKYAIGPYPQVTLAAARTEAQRLHQILREGIYPKDKRSEQKRAAKFNGATLAEIVGPAFEARKHSLHRQGEAGRWLSPLQHHVLPTLGNVPVNKIDQQMIRDCLAPIWVTKAETARKSLSRLGIVLRYAAAEGRDVNLNALLLAKTLLGAQPVTTRHHPAMRWQDVPNFFATLGTSSGDSALKFLILTGARSSNGRFARWEEMQADRWVIPSEKLKVKTQGPFEIPRTPEIDRVLEEASKHPFSGGYIFPSPPKAKNRYLSENAMARTLQRRNVEASPHGFRSAMRSWVEDNDITSERVAEAMLHHQFGSKASRSYARGYFFDRRVAATSEWTKFVASETVQSKLKVVA